MSNTLLPTTPLIAQQTPQFFGDVDDSYNDIRFVWTFTNKGKNIVLTINCFGSVSAVDEAGRSHRTSDLEELTKGSKFFVPFTEGLVTYRELVDGFNEGNYHDSFSQAYRQQQG